MSTLGDGDRRSFGVIGLGVMGRNLALNLEDHGVPVVVWNRTSDRPDDFLARNAGKRLVRAETLEELTSVLDRPRRILLMVKAGAPVDAVLEALAPLLGRGDVVLDGGNSAFTDTRRRQATLDAKGIALLGVGISGGEAGARHGPSLMPGGDRRAYDLVQPVLEAIAASTESGPCVTYVGPDGAGHFVKTVHNGIEYADMQLIAESYDLLRNGLGLQLEKVAEIFSGWNGGPLASYLIELTATVLVVRDEETGRPLVDLIEDQAGQKGTGKWAAQVAMDLGVPVPTISAAIDARLLSDRKVERVTASRSLRHEASWAKQLAPGDRRELVPAIRDALLASRIVSNAQGMSLIATASREHGWSIDLREIARIWKGGCIIRSRLLDPIMAAFGRAPDLANLLLDDELGSRVIAAEDALRRVVCAAHELRLPVPALSASLAYLDSYRSERLPQNLTQAQRDAFGGHGYERSDHPERGLVHTDWLLDRGSAVNR
jgi:6-phosphogluconate dehydrogenase